MVWFYTPSFFLVFFFSIGAAQNLYVDPTTTAALALYSSELKSQQEKTLSVQKELLQAQSFIGAQMVVVNDIQNKVLLGLSEVSQTLSGGLKVKEVYEDLSDCAMYAGKVTKLASKSPAYAIFGAKATAETYQSILVMSEEISEILKGGELNLAKAGDRYRLLFAISERVKKLRMYLLTIVLNIERAERMGSFGHSILFRGISIPIKVS